MSLPNGTAIGPYEIVGWLGAGGMGEVYRARDPRLGRDVAIKLISAEVATDRTRLHRFEQEARAAGQLNHPNVLAVHDVGTHAGSPFIVSELLEGQTLGQLLGQELSVRRAIDYARQTAEGLGAAHARGIVHRDLKPDNLFVTSDGRVKILDFGIAKLTQPADGAGRQTGSPTETHPGMILGTVGYMSPEQVRGDEVDQRSDLFNLGVILYEMLSGHRAFDRGSAAETIASILREDPLDRLGPRVPSGLTRVVARCLEKTREARFQSARDLAFALESVSGTNGAATAQVRVVDRLGWLRQPTVPWTVAGALAVGLALVLWMTRPPPVAPIAMPWILSAELGPGMSLANSIDTAFGHAITISANGDLVVFAAERRPKERQLFVRRLDQEVAQPLPGTDDANSPFLSPSGQWIGFVARGKLKKIAVTGGAATVLADVLAPTFRGGAWENDHSIVFSPANTSGTRLLRVSADGRGTPAPIGTLAQDEVIQVWPQILPGDRGVLYTGGIPGAFDDANLMVQPPSGGPPAVVHRGGYHGRYLESGHLVYIRHGGLFAVAFDLQRLEKTGTPVEILRVTANATTGGAQFGVSANGRMVFRPGQGDNLIQLQMMERDGKLTALPTPPVNAYNLAFSGDARLAMDIRGDGEPNIWVYEPGKPFKALTTDPVRAIKPAWTNDSRRIAFASSRGDKKTLNIWWQLADGSGGLQQLTTSRNTQQPGSWHKSGKYLAFEENHPETRSDLMILPMAGDEASGWHPGEPTVFMNSPFNETTPAFSPNGEWLAYTSSTESSPVEVYVRPFQRQGQAVKISTNGGTLPTWSRTRNELFYTEGFGGRLMVVPYTVEGGVFRRGTPQVWSEGRYQARGPNRMFDLHPDGNQFVLAPPSPPLGDHVTFIFDFFERLRRLAPPTTR